MAMVDSFSSPACWVHSGTKTIAFGGALQPQPKAVELEMSESGAGRVAGSAARPWCGRCGPGL